MSSGVGGVGSPFMLIWKAGARVALTEVATAFESATTLSVKSTWSGATVTVSALRSAGKPLYRDDHGFLEGSHADDLAFFSSAVAPAWTSSLGAASSSAASRTTLIL